MVYEQSERLDRNSSDRNSNAGIAGIARDAYDPSSSNWNWNLHTQDTASGALPNLALSYGSAGESAANLPAQLQQLETGIQQQLQQLAQEVSQLQAELGISSQGTAEAPATTGPNAGPGTGVIDTAGGAAPASSEVSPPSALPVEATPIPTASTTQQSDAPLPSTAVITTEKPTAPASTSPTGGEYSAIGPNGNAVGSTATVFGPSAMPANAAPSGSEYYVSPDGSTSGDGSQAHPFATLQQAADAMANSSIKTTFVESGTYDQSAGLTLTSANSGETFVGSGSATLDGQGTAGNLITIDGANDITIQGLNFQNTANNPVWNSTDWSGANTGEDAILAQNTTGDNFGYNQFKNVGMAMNFRGVTNSQVNGNDISNTQAGIDVMPGDAASSGNTLSSNRLANISNVTGVSSDNVGAINLAADNNDTVINNVIQNTAGAGIIVGQINGVVPVGDTIASNTVENTNTAATPSSTYNAGPSMPSDMGAIYAWSGVGNQVQQNMTISDNYVKNAGLGFENNGIYLDDGVSGTNVKGNIVDAEGAGGASFDVLIHGGSNNTVAQNIFNLNSAAGVEQGVFIQPDGPAMTGNALTDDIFYASGPTGGAINTTQASAGDIPTMSGNQYYGVSVPSSDPNPSSAFAGFADPNPSADNNYAEL